MNRTSPTHMHDTDRKFTQPYDLPINIKRGREGRVSETDDTTTPSYLSSGYAQFTIYCSSNKYRFVMSYR